MAKLELQHLCKQYRDIIALDDFSLRLNDKSFVVLAGPSGCGKTTLLHCIAGLLPLDHGHILLNDNEITNMNSGDRNIAMVFQNAALFPHLTVYENISYGLEFQGFNKKQIDDSIHELTEILSISSLLNRKSSTLSGGQQQRVAIARALVRKPDLFLMDEPLSSLDANLKSQLRIEIAQLYQKQDATFVYVTHDQTEAMTLADVLIVMRDGRIQQIGKPKDLYHNPINLFVANFLGKYGINKIEGIIKGNKLYFFDLIHSLNLEYEDQIILLGFRPQFVFVDSRGIQGTIILIEDIGDEIYYHILVNGIKLIMKYKGVKEYQSNDKILINFDWKNALFFDKTTEERVFIG